MNRGRTLGPLHIGFALVGVATVLPGPLIPELRAAWELSHGQVAILFPAFFVASSIGSVLSDRDLRVGLLGGYTAIALGLAGVAVGSWPLPAVAMAAIGLGVGLVAPSTNLLVAYAAEPAKRSADLATLNLVWGIGAAGCPLLLAALAGRVATSTVLLALALLVGGLLGALVVTLEPPGAAADEVPDAVAPVATEPTSVTDESDLTRASLWPIAALVFVYVGTETAVAGWVVALAESLGGARSLALAAHAAFWTCLLAGRGLTPFALRRLTDRQIYGVGWGLASVGVVGLVTAGSPLMIAIAAGVAGLGCGPLFPLTVSFLSERTAGGRSGGWVFAFAGFGAAVLPWIAGRVAESSSIQLAFWVPVVALAALIAIFAATRTTGSG